MKRHTLGIFVLLLSFLLGAFPAVQAAQEPDRQEIYTAQQLLAIADDPDGNYVLMADLDMTGVSWPCPDFFGSFDGNGHAILNLTITQPGATTAKAYDGNRKGYEVYTAGLFGVMRNAEVKNLRLINVRALVDTDKPCFLGAVAGWMEYSTVTDCIILGTLELRAFDRIFGVGGAVGYGCGTISRCALDVSLICTDTDQHTKDEQFLGGVYSTGFIDVEECTVYIDGYASEYGYAHNGGIVGMYLQYPWGYEETGCIRDNTVEGKITFFEDNDDRRAYCNPFAGESLVFYEFYKGENVHNFKRDERWEYSEELRPDMCQTPAYSKTVTQPKCSDYGYTTYTCTGCGYSYTDHYTLPRHNVNRWTMQSPPTEEAEGVSEGTCADCGAVFTQSIPKLEPAPTQAAPATQATTPTQSAQTEPTEPEELPKTPGGYGWLLIIAAAAVVSAGLGLVVILRKPKRQGKRC